MQLSQQIESKNTEFLRLTRALKAARLARNLSRKDAAKKLGWLPVSIEQMENGRCNFSKERLQKVVDSYGYSAKEFAEILRDPKLVLAEICTREKQDHTVARKPRRNHYKIVTKEVRAIRILRMRKGVSQREAARLCGYVPGGFGHIEVGRIELKRERIEHILACLGYSWIDFEGVLKSPVLADEIIPEIVKDLQRLDTHTLISAANIIQALIK